MVFYCVNAIEDQESENFVAIKRYRASKGWIENFIQRHGLISVTLHEEAGIVPVMRFAEKKVQLKSILASYHLDCIYNVDETGLFHKLFPPKTYIVKEENRKSLRKKKAMKSKCPITVNLCSNANGPKKLPMAVNDKSKNPRGFRFGSPLVLSFSQRNA